MEIVKYVLGSLSENVFLESLFGSLQSLGSIGKLQILARLSSIA